MSDKLDFKSGKSETTTSGQHLAQLLEHGDSLKVDHELGLLQTSGDHGWAAAQLMKKTYDADTSGKNNLPELTINMDHERVGFSLNARDSHPLTGAGLSVDAMALPASIRRMFPGTKESNDCLSKWDAQFGRDVAETLLAVGLNSDRTTALQLTRLQLSSPDRLEAVNVYLPQDRQLEIKQDSLPSSHSNEDPSCRIDWHYKFGNQEARFSSRDEKALCDVAHPASF